MEQRAGGRKNTRGTHEKNSLWFCTWHHALCALRVRRGRTNWISMMKPEGLQRVNGKAQGPGRVDLQVVITRQCYALPLLLDKVHRREMKSIERSDWLGKRFQSARQDRQGEFDKRNPSQQSSYFVAMGERASLSEWMRVQISHSISRLEINGSCQSASGGRRSSARSCASAADVSR